MKRILMMLAMTTVVVVACDPESPEMKLDVSEATLSLSAVSVGGATFTVTSDQAWEAVADATWLTVSPASGEASDEAVTVTVTAEDNDTGDARDAVITISAGALIKTINVAQAAKAVSNVTTFEATYLEGCYYGTAYSVEQGTHNYFIILSDKGLVDPDNYYDYNTNTTYYQISLYSDVPGEGEDMVNIPNGTYQLDLENTYSEETLAASESRLIVSGENEDAVERVSFTEATVVVTDGKIVLTATLANGDSHEVTYEGNLQIANKDSDTGDEGDGSDWITEDLNIQMSDAAISIYADDYDSTIYYVEAIDMVTYDMISIALHLQGEDVAGTYTAKTADGQSGVFIPGNTETYEGSFYYSEPGAALATGTITIAEAEGVYTIILDCTDGAGHKITGTISGTVPAE